MSRGRIIPALLTASALAAAAAPATAQPEPPSYGLNFLRVGSPGNRATIPSEVPNRPYLEIGAVGYEYRMARTEIDTTQWFEFVQAYAPYWNGSPSDPSFTSMWIVPSPGGYRILEGFEHAPAQISWRVAARYCNWLHNGKNPQQWAFESGAYDTSTFTVSPNGVYNDQRMRSPGAQFWIPSRDEWAKAAYYDPDRYGAGQEGYWAFPNGTNEPLVSGLPSAGGQTNAGYAFPSQIIAMPVESYPGVRSPWGLLDLSGGVHEWSEDQSGFPGLRWYLGSRLRGSVGEDQLDWFGIVSDPTFLPAGLRIASAVPPPATVAVLGLGLLITQRRRRIK